jgi:predicted nucleic acid-binding protein
MKIFIDVNLFMDVLEKREKWKQSFAVIKSVLDGKNQGYISALTPTIIYFLRRRVRSEKQARRDVKDAVEGFKIVGLTKELIESALKEERIEDFEDAIQSHSAKNRVKILITRNKADFKKVKDEIEALTPEEFLKKYKT